MSFSQLPYGRVELVSNGLQHLMVHNANPHELSQTCNEGVPFHSMYGSLQPQGGPYSYHDQMDNYHHHEQQQHRQHNSGFDLPYDANFGDSSPSLYPDNSTTMTSPSPPTPLMDDVITTRTGKTYQRGKKSTRSTPRRRSRVEKLPTPSKSKRARKPTPDNRVVKLDKPLSVMTQHLTHVPHPDTEAFVNRSAEVRHAERRKELKAWEDAVENHRKDPRKYPKPSEHPPTIKRPMNCYMLYRKAYQLRTQVLLAQTGHNILSQIISYSWMELEQDEFKKEFKEWAKIESKNHHNAFPEYVFDPQKTGAAKKIKKSKSAKVDVDEPELEDYEWEPEQSRSGMKAEPFPQGQRQYPRSHPAEQAIYIQQSRANSAEPSRDMYNISPYHATNSQNPPHMPHNQSHLRAGEYFYPTIMPYPPIPGVEDLMITRSMTPGPQYPDLPDNQPTYGMMGPYPPFDEHSDRGAIFNEQEQVGHYDNGGYFDPMNQVSDYHRGANNDQHWPRHYPGMNEQLHMPMIDPALQQSVYPALETLESQFSQHGLATNKFDAAGEFNQWAK